MTDRCDECRGRGHFLFPLSTPPCDACGGTGRRPPSTIGVEVQGGEGSWGIDAWLIGEDRWPMLRPANRIPEAIKLELEPAGSYRLLAWFGDSQPRLIAIAQSPQIVTVSCEIAYQTWMSVG